MRVVVIGSSGSGKSTLGRRLSEACGLVRVELDALNWGPNWLNRTIDAHEDFVRLIGAATAGDRWVTDGNYLKAMARTHRRATHLIWLDYSRWVIMPRVIRRSFLRAVDGKELWPGTGNREDFRRWLDREHPIRYACGSFHRRRPVNEALFADPALAHVEKYRLRHPREAEPLIRQLAGAENTAGADAEIFV